MAWSAPVWIRDPHATALLSRNSFIVALTKASVIEAASVNVSKTARSAAMSADGRVIASAALGAHGLRARCSMMRTLVSAEAISDSCICVARWSEPKTSVSMTDRIPLIRVTAMPADTNPYGGVFGGWLMSQMALACGQPRVAALGRQGGGGRGGRSDLPRRDGGRRRVQCLCHLKKQGRTSMTLAAEAVARERDGDRNSKSRRAISPLSRSMRTTSRGRSRVTSPSPLAGEGGGPPRAAGMRRVRGRTVLRDSSQGNAHAI